MATLPEPPIFLTAEWRRLAMLNFEVDPGLLAPLVPRGTELDAWQGRTLVSLVGFEFLRTRVLGVAVPLHRDFEEVNLRFYVRREADDGLRRGVVFVKEIVPRRAIAAIARFLYGENYVRRPMAHAFRALADGGEEAAYRWRQGGEWCEARVRAAGPAVLPVPGSEVEFVTEHYWGYARQRDGGSLEYRVEHPRWGVRAAAGAELRGDLGDLYGAELAAALARPPASAFLAEGSEIAVRRGRRLEAPASQRTGNGVAG